MMTLPNELLTISQQDLINRATRLTVANANKLRTPEAIIIHKQRYLPDEVLFDLCQREYETVLQMPRVSTVPRELMSLFSKESNVVVLSYDASLNLLSLGYVPEIKPQQINVNTYEVTYVPIPIYIYYDLYNSQYNEVAFYLKLPITEVWAMIYEEAIRLRASDITIACRKESGVVYYNVRQVKVYSERFITNVEVDELIRLLATEGGSTIASLGNKPKYFSVGVGRNHRGRTIINKNYYGLMLSMRLLTNDLMVDTLDTLNLSTRTKEFIVSKVLSKEAGMRLFIGATSSGKNTTILASLRNLVESDNSKIVSLEQPVEILVEGIEQIPADTDEEFLLNADSLLRQNPDVVYFTEITARTAPVIVQQCNTAKAVYTTIHANSIADVLFRLQDITKLDIDRLLLSLHSCVFQELVRDEEEDKLYPVNRCVYFSEELKSKLYGQPIAEIVNVLSRVEREWITMEKGV